MVLKCNNRVNINRFKRILPFPLLIGFAFGVLSVYTYYLLLNYENENNFIPMTISQENSLIDFNHQNQYYQVDFTKTSINQNISLLCLIFVNNIDSLLMQQNIWLNKCDKNKIYMGKKKYNYIDHVITETYSPQPWKYYCQTLVYLHKKYMNYDWIFLAEDNVWLIYENLVHLISLINVKKHKYNYYAGQYVNGILTTNAGVLLSTNTLSILVKLLNNMDGCNTEVLDSKHEMLDFFLKKLNNITPIHNMDSNGCTLFHSNSLYVLYNATNLKPNVLKKCMSKSAITFQLDITLNYYAMFYKYILYKIKVVTNQDLMYNANNILSPPSIKDENIWRIEALYELNIDPKNMTQPDFFYMWSKKRQIVL